MGTAFFNFWNAQTFQFFVWVTESGRADTEALITKALGLVEEDEWFEMGMDVSTVARDKLADELEAILEGLRDEAGVSDLDEIGNVDASAQSFFKPILQLAINDIQLGSVAQALLMRAGKWAPDRERPSAQ